jgi:DNA polymerase III gamma/tau subunit
MDVFEVDAASNRGIDEIRDLRETVKFAPVNGRYKVYIIDEVHMLSRDAFNALLKTLEEPAEKTLLLLVAESRDRLLSTIMSRVQQVVVPDRGAGMSEARREAFAGLFVSWMRLLFKLNMQPLSAWVDQAAGLGRETQKLFLQYAQEALRACFLQTAAGIRLGRELQFGDAKFDAAFPAMIRPSNIEQMNEALNEAMYAIERNANAKITFMQLSFKMSRFMKK